MPDHATGDATQAASPHGATTPSTLALMSAQLPAPTTSDLEIIMTITITTTSSTSTTSTTSWSTSATTTTSSSVSTSTMPSTGPTPPPSRAVAVHVLAWLLLAGGDGVLTYLGTTSPLLAAIAVILSAVIPLLPMPRQAR